MKTLVDTYKGFEIYFDTDSESFVIEGDDNSETKRSYSTAKKYINDFIKNNNLFGEFDIVMLPNKSWSESFPYIVTVKGIHSNGNFLCEDKSGKKFQLSGESKYDLERYCLPSDLEKSEYNHSKVMELNKKRAELYKQIQEEESKLPNNIYELMQKLRKEKIYLWNKNL